MNSIEKNILAAFSGILLGYLAFTGLIALMAELQFQAARDLRIAIRSEIKAIIDEENQRKQGVSN